MKKTITMIMVLLVAGIFLAEASKKKIMMTGRNTAASPTPFALVQTNTYVSSGAASTHSITFSSATANNLLIVWATADTTITTGTPPSGWTFAPGSYGLDFTGNALFYKVSTGGETSATVTFGSSSDNVLMWVAEYSGMATSSPLDQVDTNILQGATIAAGPTSTTSQADELAVAFAGVATTTDVPDVLSVNNGFSILANKIRNASGASVRYVVATKKLSATGTPQCDFSMNSSGASHQVGVIATFKITTP